MTMNMNITSYDYVHNILTCVMLMSMNIYIRPDLEQKLRQEISMSGLINSLLEQHYDTEPVQSKSVDTLSQVKSVFPGAKEVPVTTTEAVDDITYEKPQSWAA